MTNISQTEQIFSLIILTLVYFLSVSISGFFEAWITKKMGDDTPEQNGFLTLNPLIHLDFVGFGLLLFTGIGWGKPIPINPYNIDPNRRNLRLITVYGSEAFANLILAFVSLVLFLSLFIGSYACQPNFGVNTFFTFLGPLHNFANIFANYSSIKLVFGMFLVRLIILNIIMGALSLIVKSVRLGIFLSSENVKIDLEYIQMIELLALLFLIYFFGNRVIILLLHMLVYISKFLITILSIC